MAPIQVFAPSRKALILECLLTSLLCFGAAWFIGLQREVPTLVSAIISATTAVAAFVFYYRRARKKGLQRVVLTESDLTLIHAGAWPTTMPWNRIREARLRSDAGFVWEIDAQWRVQLRDDGFSGDTWFLLSEELERRFKAHHIPCFRNDSPEAVVGQAAHAVHRAAR